MKILFPNNVYSRLLAENLPEKFKSDIVFDNAIAIAAKLENDPSLTGLITPIDILQHKNLYVSQHFGISFNGDISNSYLYYSKEKQNISEIYLAGDITSLEAMYTEIFFKELYDVQVQLNVFKENKQVENQNVIIIGDGNFLTDNYKLGASFGSELIDMLEVPFVNFIFASSTEDNIKQLNEELTGIESKIYSAIESGEAKLPFSEDCNALFKENISSVAFEFEDQDIDGISQLIRLPYYYGKVDDITEVCFV